jgi:hypothetical protein
MKITGKEIVESSYAVGTYNEHRLEEYLREKAKNDGYTGILPTAYNLSKLISQCVEYENSNEVDLKWLAEEINKLLDNKRLD